MQEQQKHCQEAEQLAELPVAATSAGDQQPSHTPRTMDDDPEGAGARANLPAPSSATTHSAAAGLADEQAAAGSDVSAGLVAAVTAAAMEKEVLDKKQDASALQEDDQPVVIIRNEANGASCDVQHYEAPLEARPMSNGTLAGENETIVRVLDSGQAIIMAPHATSLRPAVLRAIRAAMPGARLALPGEFKRLPPGTDVTFQGFARTQPEPEPEDVSVDSLIEETASSLVLEEAANEATKENKGKGKAIEVEAPPPDHASTASLPETPPPEIDVAWEKHPERPLQKLPIRFHDAVGRNYIWPWHKAKKWEAAKSLIESAFMHVDIIGPHVIAGHYDLLIRGAFVDNDSARISSRLSSYPPQPARVTPPPPPPPPPPLKEKVELSTSITTVAVIAPDDGHEDEVTPAQPVIESQTTSPPSPTAGPVKTTETKAKPPKKLKHNASKASSSTPSNHPPPPPPPPPSKPGRGAIILPELWDDVIEPGMVIQMHMWPMTPPIPPPPPPPPPVSHGVALPPGLGRGIPPPPGWPGSRPGMRPGPPLIIDVRKPPKGKTRKRQDGL